MSDTAISVLTPTVRPRGLKRVQQSLEDQTFQDFEWLVEVGLRNTEGSDLNAAYNRMLRRAKGELVVSVQDYIKIPVDGLERFWEAYRNESAFYTAPVGKVQDVGGEPEFDWREVPEADCNWQRWEIDYGAAPLDALKYIGGFDERLDECWGFDNVNVGFRAHREGYDFYNLPDNKAVAWDHDEFLDHPHRDKRNPDLHQELLDDIKANGFDSQL